ncbi:hypothetical protein ACFLV4_02600 [Chloroflexota bacterium]
MAKPLVDLIYNAFCTEETPQVRRLARKYGFPIREYDIWNLDASDESLPPHIRLKIGLVRSGEDGFFAGACFIDGEEVDWWAGFERAFESAREKAGG